MFAKCLAALAQRHPHAKLLHMISNDVADARNSAVMQAEGDWLWFIDTDMVFAPETLERLIAHDVDIVQVLCCMRHPPHEPVLWEYTAQQRNSAPVGFPRLVEVQSLGAGGTLYRKRVFETLTGPWFEGVIGTEDTYLAAKAKAAGLKLFVDMATPVGHITPVIVWPMFVNGDWHVRYDAMNGQSVVLPSAQSRIVKPGMVVV
jgi:glycosyltransferase involved in cell wall biosynthesis